MSTEEFDIIIVGGGPGGYVCAIRAAQLGFKVACVDKRESLGGTCLNVGCIPSKNLLNNSKKFEEANKSFKDVGIICNSVKLDFKAMMKDKDSKVKGLVEGIDYLFKKNKITKITGFASFKNEDTLEITDSKDKKKNIKGKKVIIATGSEIATLPGIKIDEKQIISSDGALELKSVPKSMVVIGGGYIGLELGSVYRRLGAEVTVVEFLDKIVPAMDSEISSNFKKILEKQGIKFKLGMKVSEAKAGKGKVDLKLEPRGGGKEEKMQAEIVLVSVGRRPFTDKLGLENAKVKTNDRGMIDVNDNFQTSNPNVFAIGDVIRGPMLAHKAEEEGVAVAELLAGQVPHINYDAIPGVVYTSPEVATVGKTEEQVKEAAIEYKVGKFPFMANSRAKSTGNADGFVKVISCAKTDTILGAHIIGPDAGTMIAELVLALEYKAASEDIVRTSHAHPTLNEAVREACMAVLGRAIHM